MDREKTIRDDVTVVEKNSFTEDKTVVETSKSEYNQQRYPFKTFREFKIVKALPATGGEADNYIVEGNGSKYFLKLYRTGIKPKEEILQKTYELSRKAPEHIIKIYEYGYDREWNRWYEVQEYIEFGNLKEFTQKRNLIGNFDFVREVIKELSEAIHNLHQMDIIHRDLKPSNVLVRKDNPLDIVLIDFGISSLLESDISKVLTTVKGTYAYSAPESFSGYFGKEVDWWAFGIIILELITGKNPLSGLSQQVIMNTIITKNVPLDDKIQEDFKVLLKGLLTRDPKKRWGYQQIKSWLEGRRDIPVYYGEDTREYSLKDWIEAGFTEQGAKIWMQVVDDPKLARILKDDVGLTPEEAKKWVDVGIKNPDVIMKWVNAGFDNPEDVKIYEDLGLGVRHVRNLLDHNFNSDAIRFAFSLKYSYNEIYQMGIEAKDENIDLKLFLMYVKALGHYKEKETLKEILFFISHSVTPLMIENAINNGISLDKYKQWIQNGFKEIDDILHWINFEPYEASKWKSAGIEPEEVSVWKKNGFNQNSIGKWKLLGFDADSAKLWKDIGFSPEISKKWIENGYSYEEASTWKENGFSASESLAYKEAGISTQEANAWKSEGFSAKDASSWKKAGFSVNEALNWKKNFSEIEYAAAWKNFGFTPEEAREWEKVFRDRYYSERFTFPKEAYEWKNRKCSPQEALKWKEYGFQPKDIEHFKLFGISFDDALKANFNFFEALKNKFTEFAILMIFALIWAFFSKNC